jgi:hypothetical protein
VKRAIATIAVAALAACRSTPVEVDYGTPVVDYPFDADVSGNATDTDAPDGAAFDATTAAHGDSEASDVEASVEPADDGGCDAFLCPDGCFDLQSDPNHCGSCTKSCGGTNTCQGGACFCGTTNYVQCDAFMENLNDDAANCGRCGNRCAGSCVCGRCLVPLAVGADPQSSLALDSTSLYWVDVDLAAIAETVNRLPLDGGASVPLLHGQFAYNGLAVSPANLYVSAQGSAITSVPLDGGAPTTLYSGEQNAPVAVAVDATNVYWAESGIGIFEFPLAAGDVTDAAAPVVFGTTDSITALVATPGGIYWSDSYSVVRTDPVTGITTDLAYSAPSAGFAYDALDLYWTTADPANLEALPLVEGGAPYPLAADVLALAADGTSVYFASGLHGALAKMPAGGGPVTELAWDQQISSIAVDATSVYWVDVKSGTINKLTPK